VNANQADANPLPVHTMCRVFNVSASGYYDWLHRAPSPRAMANAVLVERIRVVHTESDGTYGRARVCAELRDQGMVVNAKRVAALMRNNAIRPRLRTSSSASSRPTLRTSCGWPT
jgi:putative transposase